MPKFKFTAVRQGGEKYEEEMEAADKFALYAAIRKEGGTVVHIEEVRGGGKKSLSDLSIFSGVKMTDKVQFAKNLGVMIDAGLPMVRAISVIERQTRSAPFKKTLLDLNARIGRGETLSSAMEGHPKVFNRLFISMTRAGEESGSLTSALKTVGSQLEKAHLLTKKIRGAMIYPAIILCIMIVITFLMLIFVVPTLSSTFKELNVELPLMTRIVIGLSDFLKNNILISIAIIGVIVAAFMWWKKTPRGKRIIDAFILRIPVIKNIVKETNSARTARTLTSLLSAGVDILVAIKISGDVVQNVYYKDVLKKAELVVEKGKPISSVFSEEERLYPTFVGEMASIGEETGRLSEMFENVAVYYENEVDQKTKDLSTIIEPFLMIFIGVAVGFFAMAMLSPMYALVDVI